MSKTATAKIKPEPANDTPPAWEINDYGVTILRDISWEEYETLWSTADRLHRNVNWIMGDVLLRGEEVFGERHSQILDDFQVEQRNQAKWVAKRFPQARRRRWMPAVAWTLFRECSRADLDDATQDTLLDQAKAEGWRTQDMVDARKRILAERKKAKEEYPRNGAPPLDDQPADDSHLKDEDGDTPADEAEDISDQEMVLEQDQHFMETGLAPEVRDDNQSENSSVPALPNPVIPEVIPTVDGLRACFALISAAPELAVDRVRALCGITVDPEDHEIPAATLLPAGWAVSIERTEGASMWAVELQKGGHQIAVGVGNTLFAALIEAALAARISDASTAGI